MLKLECAIEPVPRVWKHCYDGDYIGAVDPYLLCYVCILTHFGHKLSFCCTALHTPTAVRSAQFINHSDKLLSLLLNVFNTVKTRNCIDLHSDSGLTHGYNAGLLSQRTQFINLHLTDDTNQL